MGHSTSVAKKEHIINMGWDAVIKGVCLQLLAQRASGLTNVD